MAYSNNAHLSSITPLNNCLSELKDNWEKQDSLASIWNKWPELAGDQLSVNCCPLEIRLGILYIGASHPQWLQALQYNKCQLLAKLKAAGFARIKDIKIQRYYPSKRSELESQKSIWERHPSRIDVHGLGSCSFCGSPAPSGEMALWNKCGFCRRKDL
tara:strand:- start:1603 stop:2076 length:474 start_codon:yes stop_codon:yes gene_type:complete